MAIASWVLDDLRVNTLTALTSITGPITAAGSVGQVQFNGSPFLAADSNLFWDNTNKRLGIGTSSPISRAEISAGYLVIDTPIQTSYPAGSTRKGCYLTPSDFDGSTFFGGGLGFSLWYDGTNYKTGTDGGSNGGSLIRAEQSGAFIAFYTVPNTGVSQQTITPANLLNYRRVIIDDSGKVGIGIPTPAYSLDTAGIINATQGYLYNGVATSGHVLRGNGSAFVDAALTAGDLPAYILPDNGESTAWVKLGTWVAGQLGSDITITVVNGKGFNTNAADANITEIIARNGNDTAAPNLSLPYYWSRGNPSNISVAGVKFVATGNSTSISNRSWDIWISLPIFSHGHFTVSMTAVDTFTYSGALGSDPGAAAYIVAATGASVILSPSGLVSWSLDTGISRDSAGVIDIGNGTQGDTSGNLQLNKITKYGGIATVSNGVPSEYATVDLTTQSANIAATTLYAVPASGAGMYRITWSAKVTTPATTSCVLGGANGFQIGYTDADDSVAVTTPAWWGGGNNGLAPNSAAVNTTQNQLSGEVIVNAKASTNITFSFGYTSVGVTAMQYSLHVKLEAL